MMRNWLKAERRALASYRDDALLAEAISRGLSPDAYTILLWERLPGNAGSAESSEGDHAVMRTDMHACKVRPKTIKDGCDWLLEQGLPRASCAIALHHEQTHVRQCQAGIPDLMDLRSFRDREVEAYEKMIREIEGWIRRNCRG
jgi:hypothetical protein